MSNDFCIHSYVVQHPYLRGSLALSGLGSSRYHQHVQRPPTSISALDFDWSLSPTSRRLRVIAFLSSTTIFSLSWSVQTQSGKSVVRFIYYPQLPNVSPLSWSYSIMTPPHKCINWFAESAEDCVSFDLFVCPSNEEGIALDHGAATTMHHSFRRACRWTACCYELLDIFSFSDRTQS